MNQSVKLKRWTVLKRSSSTSLDWRQVGESESFEVAKQLVIQEYKKVGLECLMLCRPVDLTTVLYPIN